MTATDMDNASDLSITDPDANAPDEDASVADMMILINDAGADLDMMTTAGPQVCNPKNMGQCECSNQAGFTTYTWEVAGQQRCFTVYTPESEVPLPVIVQMNCYAQNGLRAGGEQNEQG